MAGKRTDLAAALKRFDDSVKSAESGVAKTLRPGAPLAALTKLEKAAGAIPAELRAWFSWHDGQSGTKPFAPSENYQLISAKDAADAWAFLEKKANKPWKSAWLPITTNGAGDHLVYDRANGTLIRYYHDETMRPKAAPALAHWVLAAAKEWEGASKSKLPARAPGGWTAVPSPKKAALAKKPDGTAFHFRATSNLGKGIFFHLFWKQEADTWFQATSTTLERCWTTISNNLFPFQVTPDRGMEYCLSAEKVFVDGKDAAHGGLFEQHFAKPPFPRKK